MPIYIEMPKLSDTMTEGTLVKWHKSVGDTIEIGDILADVETDKATMEMESFEEGTLHQILIAEGSKVAIGEHLAVLLEEGEEAPKAGAEKKTTAKKEAEVPQKEEAKAEALQAESKPKAAAAEPAAAGSGGRIKASPLARKMAAARGVELTGVSGSGPGGRIVAKDVTEAGTKPASGGGSSTAQKTAPSVPLIRPDASAGESETIQLSGMRKVIAERLLASKTQIPHFYLHIEVDAEPIARLRRQLNQISEGSGGGKITINDFVLLATARAAAQHPKVNASFAGDSVVQYASVNLAVAVAVDDGLVTPVIRGAHALTLKQISETVKDLAGRARSKKLKPEEYQGGTITVSNLGAYGVERFAAIINPPQAAIIAVGAILKKPVVNDKGEIVVGERMSVSLSCDHRVIDGAVGAEFLGSLKRLLENPALMLF
jgi:pyruvate dehydrogenase E2 component (dihydrolipoamide acetyltransferase)